MLNYAVPSLPNPTRTVWSGEPPLLGHRGTKPLGEFQMFAQLETVEKLAAEGMAIGSDIFAAPTAAALRNFIYCPTVDVPSQQERICLACRTNGNLNFPPLTSQAQVEIILKEIVTLRGEARDAVFMELGMVWGDTHIEACKNGSWRLPYPTNCTARDVVDLCTGVGFVPFLPNLDAHFSHVLIDSNLFMCAANARIIKQLDLSYAVAKQEDIRAADFSFNPGSLAVIRVSNPFPYVDDFLWAIDRGKAAFCDWLAPGGLLVLDGITQQHRATLHSAWDCTLLKLEGENWKGRQEIFPAEGLCERLVWTKPN